MRGRVNFPGLFNKCQTNIKTLTKSKLCSSVENAQTSVMYISDKMLMSFNGWNPELLNMNHGQNIVSIMSRFTCKKKFVFCLIYYNDNTLCFINICWLYENIKKGYLEALSILCNAHLHRE